MVKKRSMPPTEPPAPASLTITRSEAAEKITARMAKGEAMNEQLDAADRAGGVGGPPRSEFDEWTRYNAEMLRRMFTDSSIAGEYELAGPPGEVLNLGGRNPLWDGGGWSNPQQDELRRTRGEFQAKLAELRAIKGRLDLYDEPTPTSADSRSVVVGTAGPYPVIMNQSSVAPAHTPARRAVFVVHGHDEGAREATARVLQQLDVEPIILHEQANRGQTVIEKFERHAGVPFAVVLLTPDDLGRAKGDTNLEPRARQNVWFELGYFVGKLGRDRVCALYRGPLEIPSDIKGVIYTPMDDGGGWRLSLAQELDAAGIEVDFNRLRRGK